MQNKKSGPNFFEPLFLKGCRRLLIVSFLALQFLNVNCFQSLLPFDHTGFGEFLTVTQFFHHTGRLKFSFQLFQSSVDGFAIFYGNNNHKKYLFLLKLIMIFKGLQKYNFFHLQHHNFIFPVI